MNRKTLNTVLTHAILIITLIGVAFPMYYAFVMATHTHQMPMLFHPFSAPATNCGTT